MDSYDVAVVGLGAMGSAAVYELNDITGFGLERFAGREAVYA